MTTPHGTAPARNVLSRSILSRSILSRSILAIVATCWLASCAAPRTSLGLIDIDGEGMPVVVQNIEADRRTTALHLQKIDISRQIHELAAANHATIRKLQEAGRIGAPEFHASELQVLRAQLDVVDARLALAHTKLLPDDQTSFLDSDGDGLPDTIYQPPVVADLLTEKIELRTQAASQTQHALTQIQRLYEAGRASTAQVQTAARDMMAAERALLDARSEQH